MRNLLQRFNLSRTVCSLAGGLLLAGLLTACWEVNTYVKVDTCSPDSAGGVRKIIDPPDAGACAPSTPLQSPTDANRYGNAKNTVTGLTITDNVHMCNVNSVTCQSSPGTKFCGGVLKACTTRYTPTVPPDGLTGSCTCGCP